MQEVLRLRRLLDRPRKARQEETCEFCGEALAPGHSHVIDIASRRLMCACRPCYLLFVHSGAAGGKYRSAGDRYQRIALEDNLWDRIDAPVGIVFFLRNSALNRVVVFYPSPAGATESGLPPETWEEIVSTNPALGSMEPDIEALLVCRRREIRECWIVPIDACYELVGRIRREWKGFDGGGSWEEISAFFLELKAREQGAFAHV
ncbi:MAG TPA: DUF5947 family protein [Bryobacteraceae bacterium]|nr:DUF5947 family protein [Bryobacteraceae bacterium]